MDESVLQNWLEIEKKQKKLKPSAENKVKPLDILSKLKIITFKPIEVSFNCFGSSSIRYRVVLWS